MRSIVAEIELHLIPLIGLPLSQIHRVADLRVFHFGDIRQIDGASVGRYSLHVQCPWRLEHDSQIVTGQTDLWEPVDPSTIIDWGAWHYDRDGNLQDTLLVSFTASQDRDTPPQYAQAYQHIVETVQADAYGGAIITFSDNYRLAIFPAGSRGEDWRLFQPDTNGPHFVIAGGMIE